MNFEVVTPDDTSIIKLSEARSIFEHVEAFINKNMKIESQEKAVALFKLHDLSLWTYAAIGEDQRFRHAEAECMERIAKQKYDAEVAKMAAAKKKTANKKTKKKGAKK